LTYAHRFTVHRDIKPENIWVEQEGAYKLMDFGIARLLTGSQLTLTATAMGSAYYMAPEQIKDAKNIDGRADQYSLAVVLYEAVCGEVPTGRAKSLADRVKGVPRAFSMAIDRALDPTAASRFPDIESFVKALSARGVTIRGNKRLQYGLAAAGLLIAFILVWPHLGALLPDTAASERAKAGAIESQAAITELIHRIETAQRNFDERVRDDQSIVERLTDRVNMARSDGERDTFRRQLADAQMAADDLSAAKKIADSALFSVDELAGLKGKIAVGETALRDGRFAEAAQTLHQARDTAVQLLASAENLEPTVTERRQLAALIRHADAAINANGGQAASALAASHASFAEGDRSLMAGDVTKAKAAFDAVASKTRTDVQQFLEGLISNYAIIAKRKMDANDLETAQAVVSKAKALKSLEGEFQ
jgi:hypothetical protein